MSQKPKVLFITDSPHLDTGFSRVGRTVATALQASGQYDVSYLGWCHQASDKLIPFRLFGCHPSNIQDQFGQMSLEPTLSRVRPDVVITLGDEWMVRHIAMRQRQ